MGWIKIEGKMTQKLRREQESGQSKGCARQDLQGQIFDSQQESKKR